MQLEIRDQGGRSRLRLSGRWTVEESAALEARLLKEAIGTGGDVVFDAAGIEAMDLTGAWLLRSFEQRLKDAGRHVEWTGGRPEQLEFIDRTEADLDRIPTAEPDVRNGAHRALRELGLRAVTAKEGALDVLGFIGVVTASLGRIFGSLRRLRLASIVRHVYETGLTAVPIVALIAFLISVIVAYIGAQQLRKFGGEIFVVDLVTVAVLRELGVLLTAIIVAGRSGSAFAAEIGAMKLNDEVDALRAIGMDPIEVLVLPRIFGLVIALPALTVLADAMGLAGGALLSWYLVDIPFGQYLERVQGSIGEMTFWVGIIKAPVFAVLIALVGTLRGMQVRTSSRELGRLTTMAVVQSIFLVILADAVFAVIFMELDI
ncbi:MAG TPA: MlaE family lipid ABC transporter permease subunit [Vicinamibacterales bacterium]|nr:MlaE family lipid ABC transporter permease subunit [Vicinamibacterales bacterium]